MEQLGGALDSSICQDVRHQQDDGGGVCDQATMNATEAEQAQMMANSPNKLANASIKE
jgi:hypothetical protein